MISKLSTKQLDVLHAQEPKLRKYCQLGNLSDAEDSLKAIQSVFIHKRSHRRLLVAKLIFGEALVDQGRTEDAKEYATLVAQRATEGSRVYLDAVGLLSVCELRLGNIGQAQKHVVYLTRNCRNIKSERKRLQFFERLQARIKDECIINQLIDRQINVLSPELLENKVTSLVKLSHDEILEKMAISVSPRAFNIAVEVQLLMHQEVSTEDKLKLPCPKADPSDQVKSKEILEAVRRVAWKACCDPNRPVFKVWSGGLATIFGGSAFFKSIISVFGDWNISNAELIAAFTASLIKSGCQSFCDGLKPPSLVIPPHE